MFRLTILILCSWNIIVESMEVKTSMGVVKGKYEHDPVTGVSFYSFQGIPYAKAPVGDLRFQPPVPIQPWRKTLDATKPGCVCPQPEIYHSRREMSEDCLNFNIYVPANCSGLLPVMFNIHDGDFYSQSGNAKPIYGPEFFMQNDIILVTMNYRLGALGFLSLCNKKVSGNAGLKDVILALKTVRKNIRKFNGDPDRITIKGNGAGAVLTELLMLDDESCGMYNNVILHSGSFHSSKYIQLYPRQNVKSLIRELGIKYTNDDRLMKKLKAINAFEFVKAESAMRLKDPQRGLRTFGAFSPTVEVEHPGAVLTRQPWEKLSKGSMCDVPIIIGFNSQEGIEIFQQVKQDPKVIDRLNKNPDLLIPQGLAYPRGSEKRRKLAAEIERRYFNNQGISLVNVQNYINLVSDILYNYPIDHFVQKFKEIMTSPVYYYVFGCDTEFNWGKSIANITYPGASHSDDIGYVFMTSNIRERYPYLDDATKNLQSSLFKLAKYFMNYGEPPSTSSNSWPEAGEDHYHYAIYNDIAVPVYHRPLPERLGFWMSVYDDFVISGYRNATYFCANYDI